MAVDRRASGRLFSSEGTALEESFQYWASTLRNRLLTNTFMSSMAWSTVLRENFPRLKRVSNNLSKRAYAQAYNRLSQLNAPNTVGSGVDQEAQTVEPAPRSSGNDAVTERPQSPIFGDVEFWLRQLMRALFIKQSGVNAYAQVQASNP